MEAATTDLPQRGEPTREARSLLTVRDAATRLSCGRSLVYQLIADGELEAVKLGRLRRVPVDALESLVERLRQR